MGKDEKGVVFLLDSGDTKVKVLQAYYSFFNCFTGNFGDFYVK